MTTHSGPGRRVGFYPGIPMPVFAPEDGEGQGEEEAAADTEADKDAAADAEDGAGGAEAAAGDKGAGEGDDAAADAEDAAGDDKDGNPDKDKAGDIPENWRELAAGGDEDTLKALKRYGSLKGVAKALVEAQAKIRSGKTVSDEPMPDPEKDPDKAKEWRKARGIPDEATGYELPETVKKRMTDEDKPMISSFTEYAHAKGARPDVVQIASEWYFDTAEAMEADRIEADNKASEEAEESLRGIWGNGSYKTNLKNASLFVETIPGVGKDWTEARMPDGRRLGDIPDFMEWAAEQALQTLPDTVLVNGDGNSTHAGRKEEIEKIMQTDMKAYWADTAMQKEYNEILAKEERRKK